jgi:hypothetical protein
METKWKWNEGTKCPTVPLPRNYPVIPVVPAPLILVFYFGTFNPRLPET